MGLFGWHWKASRRRWRGAGSAWLRPPTPGRSTTAGGGRPLRWRGLGGPQGRVAEANKEGRGGIALGGAAVGGWRSTRGCGKDCWALSSHRLWRSRGTRGAAPHDAGRRGAYAQRRGPPPGAHCVGGRLCRNGRWRPAHTRRPRSPSGLGASGGDGPTAFLAPKFRFGRPVGLWPCHWPGAHWLGMPCGAVGLPARGLDLDV
mmetsp:Transcript_90212/g.201636  ORF Transcript_90212/g.201636 Transcript_90212/m.201636 type:complete len:202 (-) Transcript_90212:374-979(-)